jgi:hypothetical protein
MKYDVAISFLAQDEPLALSVRDALQPPLAVFVYSKAQEQLAGRDGIEAFRTVFREQAQLIVILYRQGWGETPWTRVERMAIEEFAHEQGWERMMFVRLDTSPVPKWVPKPHLYLDYSRFTLADLAGAVKSRLIELDVEVKAVSPAERAAVLARQQAFDAETRRLLMNSPLEFLGAQDALLNALKDEAKAVSEQTGWQVAAGKGALIGGFIVSAQGQGLQIVPQSLYQNSAREAYLSVREYGMNLTVEQPDMRYYATGPMAFLQTHRIDVRRLPEPLGWCWELNGRIYPPKEAARAIMQVLLDRIETAQSA